MTSEAKAAINPKTTVATAGVPVKLQISDNHLKNHNSFEWLLESCFSCKVLKIPYVKIKPSFDIAYTMRGMGNMEPVNNIFNVRIFLLMNFA
jgi:hypothetical protein